MESVTKVFGIYCTKEDIFVNENFKIEKLFKNFEESFKYIDKNEDIKGIWIVNSFGFYNGFSVLKQNIEDELLDKLTVLFEKADIKDIRVVLPMDKSKDTELIVDLISHQFYNFYFVQKLDKNVCEAIYFRERTFKELEEYIDSLPVPKILETDNNNEESVSEIIKKTYERIKIKKPVINLDIQMPKISLPKFPVSTNTKTVRETKLNTVLFYGEDDAQLVYASCLLTAIDICNKGGSVLVLELPSSGSRLGSSLGIRNPRRNMNSLVNSLREFTRIDLDDYCFNCEEYIHDEDSIDKCSIHKKLPKSLYFLPDNLCSIEDYMNNKDYLESALLNWCFLEKQIDYIFYIGFNTKYLLNIARIVIYTMQCWPGSFVKYINEINNNKGIYPVIDIIGAKETKKEINGVCKKPIVISDNIKKDFVDLIYFRLNTKKLSDDTVGMASDIYRFINEGKV